MDTRIENIFMQEMEGDTSFTDKPSGLARLLHGPITYSQLEAKNISTSRGISF